jgi:hypothetical protein
MLDSLRPALYYSSYWTTISDIVKEIPPMV